jgi:hypothetical protein
MVTVGGKIVQVYGTSISDLTIVGEFGVGGWQQQEKFLAQIKAMANTQALASRVSRSQREPSRFVYPPRGWDFLVYLKSFGNPEGSRSIRHAPEIFNPKWQLTLFIVEDNSGIKRVAQDAYIARLAKGIGWKRTRYNGPDDSSYLQQIMGGQTAQPTAGSTTQPEQEGFPNRGMGNQTTDVERWTSLVQQYFPINYKDMLCIMSKESGGNPNAKNAHSTAMGLFQVMASVWADAFGLEPENLYHPETNVRIAKKVYDQQGYSAWPNTSKACGLR